MRLFCCDSCEELQNLKQLGSSDYLVATSKYEFYKTVKDQEEYVVFLESQEIYPYEIVWGILDRIHEIVDAVCGDEYAHLFHFRYSLEGEYASKLSQMIINLNLIHGIVRNHNIKGIYLYDNKDNWIINESIALYAEAQKIEIHIIDPDSKEFVKCLTTLKSIGMEMEKFNECRVALEEEKKNLCLISKPFKEIQSRAVQNDEIGVLYCCKTAYSKHVEWTLKRIGAIGGRVRVICYYDMEDMAKFKDKGLTVDCMEDFFATEEFREEWQSVKDDRKKILYAVEQQLEAVHLGVDLLSWIVLKLKNFYYRELINRVYMNVCAKNYFKHHEFHYIDIWGGTDFWETRICYFNTRKSNTKLFTIGTWGFIKERNRNPYLNMCSAVFVPNEERFKSAYKNQFLGKVCQIPSMIWGGKNNRGSHYKRKCKGKTIGFFPTGIVSGYTTFYFYYHGLLPLIEKLLNQDFEIVFKNHPGTYDCWEEDIKERFKGNKSFKYHDAFEAVNSVIESCDVVITDISCVVFDATVMNKAVLCFVDRQGYELISHHESGYFIYSNMEDLIENIKFVLKDNDRYLEVVEKQNKYLMEYMGNSHHFDKELIRKVLYSLG